MLNEQYRKLLYGQPVTPADRDPSMATAAKDHGLTYPEMVTLQRTNPDEYRRIVSLLKDSAFD